MNKKGILGTLSFDHTPNTPDPSIEYHTILGLVVLQSEVFQKTQEHWTEMDDLAVPYRTADCYIRTYRISKLGFDIDRESLLRMFSKGFGAFKIIVKYEFSTEEFYGYVLACSGEAQEDRVITLREYRVKELSKNE